MKKQEVVLRKDINRDKKHRYKIVVVGTGYVGLSLAVLLAQHHQVTAVDLLQEKVDLINKRKSLTRRTFINLLVFKRNKQRIFKKCKL